MNLKRSRYLHISLSLSKRLANLDKDQYSFSINEKGKVKLVSGEPPNYCQRCSDAIEDCHIVAHVE